MQSYDDEAMTPNRRNFLQLPIAFSLAAQTSDEQIKICRRLPAELSDEEMLSLKQIGLRWARVRFDPKSSGRDYMARTAERYGRYGMKIHSAVHYSYRELDVQLGRPGRDRHIESYAQFLSDCGELGIPVASYDFHPGNTYTTDHVESERGYQTREFRLDDFRNKVEKQRHERVYPVEEIWENYTYFMKATLPVANQADVTMSLHPDDPPLAMMNGVGKMLVHYDGYRRAEQISESIAGKGSPGWGLTFCVGTWSEGGDKMGKDVFEMIDDFGRRGKIAEVHFRAVSSPLPNFTETLPDEGYLDLYRVMRDLKRAGFSGAVMPDHVPALGADKGINPAGTAYCIAYMRALVERASAELA